MGAHKNWQGADRAHVKSGRSDPPQAQSIDGVPGVNYVDGSRQLRRRVGAPTPLPWQGGGPRFCWGLLAGN